MVAILKSGPFNGAEAPIPVAGVGGIWLPHWLMINASAALTTTATRLYYIPFYFPEAGISYTGLKTRNTGAGDSGDTYRVGVYEQSSTTGLPSTLVADVGEVTLTAAAADRTTASSWTTPYKGWGYLAFHANEGSAMQRMQNISEASSGVGLIYQPPLRGLFPTLAIDAATYGPTYNSFAAYYVDTAYGALASSAVAPTAFTQTAPIVAPYIT